jgi:hypothetical protein
MTALLYCTASIIGACLAGWMLYSAIHLLSNYHVASKIGVPIRVVPVDHCNPIWMILDRLVVTIFNRLPLGLGKCNLTRYGWRGWEVKDKCQAHLEMGDVFTLVSPGQNGLHICDPDAVFDILQRSRDFPRPMQIYG